MTTEVVHGYCECGVPYTGPTPERVACHDCDSDTWVLLNYTPEEMAELEREDA